MENSTLIAVLDLSARSIPGATTEQIVARAGAFLTFIKQWGKAEAISEDFARRIVENPAVYGIKL